MCLRSGLGDSDRQHDHIRLSESWRVASRHPAGPLLYANIRDLGPLRHITSNTLWLGKQTGESPTYAAELAPLAHSLDLRSYTVLQYSHDTAFRSSHLCSVVWLLHARYWAYADNLCQSTCFCAVLTAADRLA